MGQFGSVRAENDAGTRRQGGAFRSAEGTFPTVDNGFLRSPRDFSRPQFCKQPLENLTARLARAMRRILIRRISLIFFWATSGSVLRNPTLKKNLCTFAPKCAALGRAKFHVFP